MRKQLLLTVAAAAITAAISGPAATADLRVRAAPPPPPAPTWAGLYIGGHAGVGRARFIGEDVRTTGVIELPSQKFNANGFLVGLHAGYNWQTGIVVFGIEGDITAAPGWEKRVCGPGNAVGSACDITTAHAIGRLDALASIRGRLGLAFDRSLIYATGGVAWARKTTSAGTTDVSQHYGIKGGWVVGGGIDWKYNQGLSLRLEGLHYVFDDTRREPIAASAGVPTRFGTHGLQDVSVIRLGASWHLQPN